MSYREHRLLHRNFRLFLLVRAAFVPLKVNSFFSLLAVTLQGSCFVFFFFFLPVNGADGRFLQSDFILFHVLFWLLATD